MLDPESKEGKIEGLKTKLKNASVELGLMADAFESKRMEAVTALRRTDQDSADIPAEALEAMNTYSDSIVESIGDSGRWQELGLATEILKVLALVEGGHTHSEWLIYFISGAADLAGNAEINTGDAKFGEIMNDLYELANLLGIEFLDFSEF